MVIWYECSGLTWNAIIANKNVDNVHPRIKVEEKALKIAWNFQNLFFLIGERNTSWYSNWLTSPKMSASGHIFEEFFSFRRTIYWRTRMPKNLLLSTISANIQTSFYVECVDPFFFVQRIFDIPQWCNLNPIMGISADILICNIFINVVLRKSNWVVDIRQFCIIVVLKIFLIHFYLVINETFKVQDNL